MSLNGALHVGRSAMNASSVALQVAGNNMANAATEGFSRRTTVLSPLRGDVVGRNQFVGRGVQLTAVKREVDTALQARLRDAISEESSLLVDRQFLSSLETIQNELTENDLSTLLSEFFNAFSELANTPNDDAKRAVVIQQGENVANRIADLERDISNLRDEVDRQLDVTSGQINEILEQVAAINVQIAQVETDTGEAASLRDRRDALLDDLSKFVEVTAIEQGSGSVDVLINSLPVVLGSVNRGIEVRRDSVGDRVEATIRIAEDGSQLTVREGTIGGLLQQRDERIQPAVDELDRLASALVFELNRLHSQGQAGQGFTNVQAENFVRDPSVALNSDIAELPFEVGNGSFMLHVTHVDSGQRTAYRIDVDGDTTSFQDILDEINSGIPVPNVTASTGVNGELVLASDAGYEMSFSDDTSGVLAALGVNSFFEGVDASTISVRDALIDDPTLLAAASGHVPGSNGTALAIADLQDDPIESLGNVSLRSFWQNRVNALAVQSASARDQAESAGVVRQSLEAQREAISGVSLDEESINLLTYQRQFQAAARFIQTIDEAIQQLLAIA